VLLRDPGQANFDNTITSLFAGTKQVQASHVKDRHISRILNGMIVHNDNWRMRQASLSRRMNRAEEASKEISNRQEHIENLDDATKAGFAKISEASMLSRKGYTPIKSEYSAANLLKAVNRSEIMDKERRSNRAGGDLGALDIDRAALD
jgi:hypothetical protein